MGSALGSTDTQAAEISASPPRRVHRVPAVNLLAPAAWTLIVVAVGLIALDVLVRGTAATADGVSYLSMAEGLRHVDLSHWSGAPTGLWPYGYPAALAALGATAGTMIGYGFVVQLACLTGMVGYLVLIARSLSSHRPSGVYLVGAAAVLVSPVVLAATRLLESEMLFTFVGLAFCYHAIVRSLLSSSAPQRVDLAIGTVAAFVLPNIRFIGVAAPLGLAAGAAVLLFLRDPDARVLARRAVVPIAGGLAGTATAMLVNLLTTDTLTGGLVPQVDVVRSTVMFSAATFWQLLVAEVHFPLFRYEVAAGAAVAIVLAVLVVRTARAAWGVGGVEYQRFTVWTWSGIGVYVAILYWRAVTTLVDPIAPRFFLPILPLAVMWLIYSYVAASAADRPARVLRADRIAGVLVVALWLGSFIWSVAQDLVRPSREGDLDAVQLSSQDHACLDSIADAPAAARISNNAALLWLATDGRITAKQASYESNSPDDFYFIDTREDAVGEVPDEILAGTGSAAVCSGEHLVVEHRTRR